MEGEDDAGADDEDTAIAISRGGGGNRRGRRVSVETCDAVGAVNKIFAAVLLAVGVPAGKK